MYSTPTRASTSPRHRAGGVSSVIKDIPDDIIVNFAVVIEESPVDEWQRRTTAFKNVVDNIPHGARYGATGTAWYNTAAILRHLAIPISELLKDPRSTVVKRTCHHLAELFNKCQSDARYLFKDLMPTILGVHAQTVQVIRQAVQAMVLDIISEVPCKMVMPLWMERLKVDKSRTVREACVLYLGHALKMWDNLTTTTNVAAPNIGANKSVTSTSFEDQEYLTEEIWMQVGKTLVGSLRDPSPAVRASSKSALERMQKCHPEYWDSLLSDKDGPVSKDPKLQRWLKSLGSGQGNNNHIHGNSPDAEELSVASKFSYNSDIRIAHARATTGGSLRSPSAATVAARRSQQQQQQQHLQLQHIGGSGSVITEPDFPDNGGGGAAPSKDDGVGVPTTIAVSTKTRPKPEATIHRGSAGALPSRDGTAAASATTIVVVNGENESDPVTETNNRTGGLKPAAKQGLGPPLRVTTTPFEQVIHSPPPVETTNGKGVAIHQQLFYLQPEAVREEEEGDVDSDSNRNERKPKNGGKGTEKEEDEVPATLAPISFSVARQQALPSNPQPKNRASPQQNEIPRPRNRDKGLIEKGGNDEVHYDERDIHQSNSFPSDLNLAFGREAPSSIRLNAVVDQISAARTIGFDLDNHDHDELRYSNDDEDDDVEVDAVIRAGSESVPHDEGPFIGSMQELKIHASRRRSRNSILMQERFRMSSSNLEDVSNNGSAEFDNKDPYSATSNGIAKQNSNSENEVPVTKTNDKTAAKGISRVPPPSPVKSQSQAPEHMVIAIRLLRAHKEHVDLIMETLKIEMDTLRDFDRLLEEPGRPTEEEVLDYFESVGLCLEQRTQASSFLQREMDRICRGEPAHE